MAAADGQGDGGWSAGLQPGLDLREQHRRVLIGDEAEGEFGKGTAWQYGFRSFALVPATEAVDFGGRARPRSFHGTVPCFAEKRWGTGEF